MTSDTAPFVLLDDARPGGRAVLYSEPDEIIQTRDSAEIRACLIIHRRDGETRGV